MEIWEQFEIDSTNYLNENFGKYATFERQGGSDSTVPDILVKTNKGESFYIEAKHCPAQCGQFVLLPNLKNLKFDYSTKNINAYNQYAGLIMNEMDKDFDAFKESGTAGKDIIFPGDQKVFSDWIVTFYKNKGVKFIITNGYRILKIDDFSKIYNITAKYRIKRSGSSSVGKSNMPNVKKYLISNYSINSIREDNDKLFIKSNSKLHDKRFIIGGYEYMISKRNDEFEIRKLSNTFNANVIFSIEINPQSGINFISDEDFVNHL
jgi:hypothetical protein